MTTCMNGTSLPEIRAVMGHEMGHYRLHHGLWLTLGFTVAMGVGYFVVNRVFGRIQRRRGERWGVRDLADPAGVPLAMAILMIVLYLLTPVTNTMIRTAENQADAFGLEAARRTARLCECCHAAEQLSQARAGVSRRDHLLRSSQRQSTSRASDAVAQGTSTGAVSARTAPSGTLARSLGRTDIRSLGDPATALVRAKCCAVAFTRPPCRAPGERGGGVSRANS